MRKAGEKFLLFFFFLVLGPVSGRHWTLTLNRGSEMKSGVGGGGGVLEGLGLATLGPIPTPVSNRAEYLTGN